MTSHPKPAKGTAQRERARRRRAWQAIDRLGSQAAADRSRGRCEARVASQSGLLEPRCPHPAEEVHHCLSGHGQRGRGESAKAENKLALCRMHHGMLHGTPCVLVQRGELGGPWWFERVDTVDTP